MVSFMNGLFLYDTNNSHVAFIFHVTERHTYFINQLFLFNNIKQNVLLVYE